VVVRPRPVSRSTSTPPIVLPPLFFLPPPLLLAVFETLFLILLQEIHPDACLPLTLSNPPLNQSTPTGRTLRGPDTMTLSPLTSPFLVSARLPPVRFHRRTGLTRSLFVRTLTLFQGDIILPPTFLCSVQKMSLILLW